MFVYELSGFGINSRYSNLNVWYCAYFTRLTLKGICVMIKNTVKNFLTVPYCFIKLFHSQQSFKVSWILCGKTIPPVSPSRNWVKVSSIHLIRKVSGLSSCLLLLHKKNYAYLTDSQYYTWLLKKYFHLNLSQSSPPSLTNLRFSHSSSMNTNLGKSSKFSMPSISKQFSSSSTITTFSEGLSSSMKP